MFVKPELVPVRQLHGNVAWHFEISGKKYRSRFLISGTNKFWLLRGEDVAYFYFEERTTFAVTANDMEHILDLSINKLEEQLDPSMFFRVNRQMILNVDAIDQAIPSLKGKIRVMVAHPSSLILLISEGRVSAFKLWLNFWKKGTCMISVKLPAKTCRQLFYFSSYLKLYGQSTPFLTIIEMHCDSRDLRHWFDNCPGF